MIFNKKNTIWSLLKVPFRYSPFLALLIVMQKIVDAIIPTFNVLIVARFINTAIDIFAGKKSYSQIYLPLLFIVLLLAFQLLFGTIMGYDIRKKRIYLNNRIATECMHKQAAVAFKYIDDSESFMQIKRVFGDLPSQINTIFGNVFGVFSLLIRFISIMLVFVSNNLWWIGFIILASSFPMVFLTYNNSKKMYRFYKESFPGQMEMYHSTYILKDRSVVDERTLFGFSNAINSKWKNMQLELYEKKKRINKKILFNRYLSRFINLFFVLIIIAVMTKSLISHSIDVGLYIALVTNIIALIDQVISSAMGWANSFAQEREFLKDFDIVCNYEYDNDYLSAPTQNDIPVNTIEFQNVSFAYPGTERKVLNNVSFIINRGEHYAFVGKNGAGKSTIIKLLTRLYDDYEGTILVNNNDIRTYTYSEIKGMFGIIYQDYAKYELTLKDNVRIGDVNSLLCCDNNEKYIKTLADVNLMELVDKLPMGSETFLGKTEENGQSISGGEWQRIAIARALMREADFMILDEPTASLDPIAEGRLYQQFTSIRTNKTTLLISHRLGSLKTVDHIFVIDNGEIVESGTHAQLIAKSGLYNRLYSEQKEWYK